MHYTTTPSREWALGATAYDRRTKRTGEVREIVHLISGPHAWMRPAGGGKEWTAPLISLTEDAPVGDDAP
ncbi:hypothetical protein AB0O91_00130 [Kitasatospora sp. NPDC089797]|uniref:hypothetical protein n=1 Tax=Kitasatospora sp. NPDC089797 TaxID=3155298 RepID=UPI0034243EE5